MRKILLVAMLSVSLSTLADNPCMPNLIKEDMCVAASKFAVEINRDIPVDLGGGIKLTAVKAEQRRVILAVTFPYNMDVLKSTVSDDKKVIDDSKAISRKVMKTNLCTSKTTRAFINLGGEIQQDSFFSDGSIYDSLTVTSCD
ncbi:hypothetical protein [Morganella morganii]|uniref:hypothetical protein n=1 Tax=Morganella morganii TaxID=582 RepID=UPI00052D13EB|nr:hypothetical protein [Morganella morganii]KGP45059.1 hypothetical protein LR61_07650 [Morganella morganii]